MGCFFLAMAAKTAFHGVPPTLDDVFALDELFWNRTNAYRRLGFDTYWAIDDFVLDDMNGAFLSDASLYRQVSEKITPWIREGVPVFSYVVTYFGHWDYPLNESRPPKVATRSTVPEVEAFANMDARRDRFPVGAGVGVGAQVPKFRPPWPI